MVVDMVVEDVSRTLRMALERAMMMLDIVDIVKS